MNRITDVVKNLLILNVIIFFGVSLTAGNLNFPLQEYFQLYSPISEHFKPVQLVTHMFMHGSISHLLFNMLSLFFLGPLVEQRMGPKRFLIFYLICGFGALAMHIGIDYFEYLNATKGLDPDAIQSILTTGKYNSSLISAQQAAKIYSVHEVPMVGASGAIMGVIIAFATLFPNLRLMLLFPPIPIKAKYLALVLVGIDLFSGVNNQGSGIAHFAHLGGALTGFILINIWYKIKYRS